MILTLVALKRSLGPSAATAGRRLAEAGAATVGRIDATEGLFFGRVAEPGVPEARVAGRFGIDDVGKPAVTGVCSCDAGSRCRHVAALAWAARSDFAAADPAPRFEPEAPPPVSLPPASTPATPVPQLRFFGRPGGPGDTTPWRRGRAATLQAMAQLSFVYGRSAVLAFDSKLVPGRDPEFERLAIARLEGLGIVPARDVDFRVERPPTAGEFVVGDPYDQDEREIVSLGLVELPRLRDEGWQVTIDDNYPYRLVEGSAEWYADVREETGHDWFGLEIGIEVDGKRVSLLPILLGVLSDARWRLTPEQIAALPDEGYLPARLRDGRILPLPAARVRAVLWALAELYGTERLGRSGTLDLGRLNAPRLADLEDAMEGSLRWTGGNALRDLGRKLRDFHGIAEAPVPRGFVGTLRPYQVEGLSWLQFLREHGLSGVLADDMGLGKTVMLLAHLLAEKEAGRATLPSLVVAPTSLMPNWRRETERFAPDLRVLVLQGPGRHARVRRIEDHDLVLTTYPLLPRDEAVLITRRWHVLVLDEAQFVKNPNTKAAKVAARIPSQHRLCLTGTPMENHLGELWSLFHVLMPGLLGEEERFRRVFRTPIEREGSWIRREQLAARIRPFLLRRTKEHVAADLPPKTEITQLVELSGPQRDLYESIRLAMHERVRAEVARKGLGRSTIVLLEALLRLRQVCCDPRLLKMKGPAAGAGSAKLEALLGMVEEMVDEGRRILLFSQFTSMLALIETELKARSISYVKLTGTTRDRDTPVRKFQQGEAAVFLISLKAGGTGLNLPAADTVIHYDPWWNPAVENQATDRAHRIGQDKPVFVYKLIVAGSVEEKIVALQGRKRALAAGIYGPDAGLGRLLTPEDVEALFQPIE